MCLVFQQEQLRLRKRLPSSRQLRLVRPSGGGVAILGEKYLLSPGWPGAVPGGAGAVLEATGGHWARPEPWLAPRAPPRLPPRPPAAAEPCMGPTGM